MHFEKPDVEHFFQTLTVDNFTVSPDESQLVISANLNGQFNLWAMDLPSQFPYPLAFVNQASDYLSYAMTGEFIVTGFGCDGDEHTQLYAIPPYGGKQVPLRTKEGERHFFSFLSDDGKRLYYYTTTGNSTYFNSYVYHIESKEERLLLEGSEAPSAITAVSPAESSFVSMKQFGNTHSLGYVHINGNTYLMTPATKEQHTVSDAVYVSEEDVYFLTNYQSNLTYLAKFHLDTKTFTKVLMLEREDFASLHYSKKDGLLYLVGSYGVEDRLYAFNLVNGKLDILASPSSIVKKLIVMPSGNLYIQGRSATRPNNIFKSSDQAASWEELTHFRVHGVQEEDLVEPEVLKYPSFDGLEIEALFFRSKEELSNGHVILWPHGGPQSLERKWFRSVFQVLLNRGYSIFAPNFRGSSNYGLAFMKMVEGDWGHGPRLDNLEGLKWIIENDYADKEKILVMGGSFGGYMSLLLHGQHPEYFKAVVDIFGPSNLFSFIGSVPDFWKPYMTQWLGDPEKDKERLTKDSPITYLDGMTKPMLVIQGANDPRVVQKESDQIVAALEKQGRDVEYLVLPDEGHGFSKQANEILVYGKIVDFFDRAIGKNTLEMDINSKATPM